MTTEHGFSFKSGFIKILLTPKIPLLAFFNKGYSHIQDLGARNQLLARNQWQGARSQEPGAISQLRSKEPGVGLLFLGKDLSRPLRQ